ncbi:hypothetical protein D3C87_1827450 [compost metagenome]
MQHGLVTYGDALTYRQRKPGVGMQHRAFLDIAVLPDANWFVVPPQNSLGPDTDALLKGNVADDGGILRNKGFGVDGRNERVELIDSHGSLLRLECRFSKRRPHTVRQCARRCNPTRA